MKVGTKVEIIKDRLKGEKGTVVGTSDLNMEHKIIVSRENPKARDPIMGFGSCGLRVQGPVKGK